MNEDTKASFEANCTRLPVVAWWLKNSGGEKDLVGLGSGEHVYQGVYDEKIFLCRITDAQAMLAEKDARIAELERLRGDGTTSDKYRAELYDEVRQRAAGMGYGNVTMALEDLDAFRSHIHTDNAETLAVATVSISHFRQDPTMENVDFQLDAKLPCGTHKLYLAPPAQASAWVQDSDIRSAAARAYGFLWHVNNEPGTPSPMYSADKAAYRARIALRDQLTSEERGKAIHAVGIELGRYEPATADSDVREVKK